MDINDPRLIDAVDEADEAFWQVIAEKFPECKSGDLCFGVVMPLYAKQLRAVQAWVEANKREEENGAES